MYFDFEYIKKLKSEFTHFTEEKIIQEYLKNPTYIFNKKLDNFDYNFYVNYYSDLKHMNFLQACNHYLMHGNNEKRYQNPSELDLRLKDFDYKFYTSYYSDLKHFDLMGAINHYLTYGNNEKRYINKKQITNTEKESKKEQIIIDDNKTTLLNKEEKNIEFIKLKILVHDNIATVKILPIQIYYLLNERDYKINLIREDYNKQYMYLLKQKELKIECIKQEYYDKIDLCS